jgi:NMD protein affecting ribosome stability and mRNA decay
MLRHVSHPTFVARAFPFPIAGSWSLRIEARRDRFELYTTTVTVRIAPVR